MLQPVKRAGGLALGVKFCPRGVFTRFAAASGIIFQFEEGVQTQGSWSPARKTQRVIWTGRDRKDARQGGSATCTFVRHCIQWEHLL